MKRLIFVIALFFLSLAGVSATQADEKADYQAALAKYHEGHYDQAVVGFQNILMKDPDSWQAYQGLGDAFLHEGDKSGAFQAYQRSLKLHPDNPTVKAMVNKLFPEPPPPLQPTPAPTAGPRPAATD
ncbi:MAG TPA: tetratricopeptide repeat protein, partial [bacterium]|nr:tetratricopeptide repeat protein [bacterium]